MSSASPILRVSPEKTLEFQVTGGVQSQVTLQLENLTDSFAAFKIKTTAPRSYLVKPSSGVIGPKKSQEINILLIPLFEPPKDPVADRFLVQATQTSSDRPLPKDEWADLALSKDKLEEKRLNVNLVWQGYGTSPSDSVPSMLTKPVPTDYKTLKTTYEELVAYAISLEKSKKKLETELDEANSKGKKKIGSSSSSGGVDIWQVIILLIVTALVARYAPFF